MLIISQQPQGIPLHNSLGFPLFFLLTVYRHGLLTGMKAWPILISTKSKTPNLDPQFVLSFFLAGSQLDGLE